MSANTDLLETVQTFFNDPAISDMEIHIGEQKYYVISKIISKFAPGLYAKLPQEAPTETLTSAAPQTPEELALCLSTLFKKNVKKQIIKITDLNVGSDFIESALKSLYGHPLNINATNMVDFFMAGINFGITQIIMQCRELLMKQDNCKLFCDYYLRAIETNSPFLRELTDIYIKTLHWSTREKVLEITSKMPYEELLHLLKSNKLTINEDFIYDIVDNWINSDRSTILPCHRLDIMSCVKLQFLSTDYIIIKVKNNPYVNSDRYHQTLEKILKSTNRDRSLPLFRNLKFAIGAINKNYEGFRLVSTMDISFNSFRSMFQNEYRMQNGIYCLETFSGDILGCDGGIPLAIDVEGCGSRLRLRGKQLEEGTIVYLVATYEDNTNTVMDYLSSIRTSTKRDQCNIDIGLFIRE